MRLAGDAGGPSVRNVPPAKFIRLRLQFRGPLLIPASFRPGDLSVQPPRAILGNELAIALITAQLGVKVRFGVFPVRRATRVNVAVVL
jgi:hypothetical protein